MIPDPLPPHDELRRFAEGDTRPVASTYMTASPGEPNQPEPRLAEIEARLKRATPGPWDWEYGVSQRTAWALVKLTPGPKVKYILRFAGPNDINICPNPEDDMDFIAHAPEDIAYLLNVVRSYHE